MDFTRARSQSHLTTRQRRQVLLSVLKLPILEISRSRLVPLLPTSTSCPYLAGFEGTSDSLHVQQWQTLIVLCKWLMARVDRDYLQRMCKTRAPNPERVWSSQSEKKFGEFDSASDRLITATF